MKLSWLLIYKLEANNGLASVILKATGERVRFDDLERGDLIEINNKMEVVLISTSYPEDFLHTVRRACDSIGIETVSYPKEDNHKERFLATFYPEDKIYEECNKLLKQYGK